MTDETFWYFKTGPETEAWLPANRQMMGVYMDFTNSYQIWRIPSTTTLNTNFLGYLYGSYEEAKEGKVYLG